MQQIEYYTGGRADLPDHKAVEVVANGRGFPIVDGQAATPRNVVLCPRSKLPQIKGLGDKPPGRVVAAHLINGHFVADGGGSVPSWQCRPYRLCTDADDACGGCINRPRS